MIHKHTQEDGCDKGAHEYVARDSPCNHNKQPYNICISGSISRTSKSEVIYLITFLGYNWLKKNSVGTKFSAWKTEWTEGL